MPQISHKLLFFVVEQGTPTNSNILGATLNPPLWVVTSHGQSLLMVLSTTPSKFSKAIVAKLDQLDFVSFAGPGPR
jgi:hypothetical protein